MTGIYILGGSTVRTPGNYHRVDSNSGQPTSKPLRQTNEYVHPSARTRIVLEGPGIEDRGIYDCKALDDYKLKMEDNEVDPKRPFALWEFRSRRKGSTRKVLPESPLWRTEKELFNASANTEIYDYIMEGPSHSKR